MLDAGQVQVWTFAIPRGHVSMHAAQLRTFPLAMLVERPRHPL